MALEDGGYRPPPPNACDPPDEYPIEVTDVDEPGEHRIFVRQTWHKNQIVDYSIQHEMRLSPDDDWEAVYRIDTSHGPIHFHQMYRTRPERKAVITVLGPRDRDILGKSYDTSYDEVFDKIEGHFRRWGR